MTEATHVLIDRGLTVPCRGASTLCAGSADELPAGSSFGRSRRLMSRRANTAPPGSSTAEGGSELHRVQVDAELAGTVMTSILLPSGSRMNAP